MRHEVAQVAVELVRALRHRVLRPDEAPEAVVYASDALDSAEHHAVRDAAGEIVGIGSLHAENRVAGLPPHRTPGYRIRGMAVAPEHRGAGIGGAILRVLLQRALALDAGEIWANARTPALTLYARHGFKGLSSEFEIPGIGPHVVMACSPKAALKRCGAEPVSDD